MIEGDTSELLPVPAKFPPHEPEYHFQIAPIPKVPPVELNVVVDPGQMADGEEEAARGEVDTVFTIMVLLTQFVELHVPSALRK